MLTPRHPCLFLSLQPSFDSVLSRVWQYGENRQEARSVQKLPETNFRFVAQKPVSCLSHLWPKMYLFLWSVTVARKKQLYLDMMHQSCFDMVVSCTFGRSPYVVPTNLFQGIKAVNPMFRGYSQQVGHLTFENVLQKKSWLVFFFFLLDK